MVKTHKTTRIESEETVRYKYPFTMQPRDDAGSNEFLLSTQTFGVTSHELAMIEQLTGKHLEQGHGVQRWLTQTPLTGWS